MTRAIWTAVLAAMLTAGAAGRSQAGIIYNNLPTDSYSPMGGVDISGTSSPFGLNSHTETFVAAASGTEADIKVPMGWFPGGTNTADFTLTLRNSSSSVLDVLQGTAPNILAPTLSVVEVFSTLHPFLTAGQTYTLTATPGSATTSDGWDNVDSNQPGTTTGFRVETASASVPEPSTYALMGIMGAVGVVGAWVRRKRAA
jgi:hypothetical protein